MNPIASIAGRKAKLKVTRSGRAWQILDRGTPVALVWIADDIDDPDANHLIASGLQAIADDIDDPDGSQLIIQMTREDADELAVLSKAAEQDLVIGDAYGARAALLNIARQTS